MRIGSIKFLICIAVVLFASAKSANAEVWKLTLEQSVEKAIAENRDIEVAKQRLIELQGVKGEAASEGLPHITGTGSYQRLWRKAKIFIANTPVEYGSSNTLLSGAEFNQLLFDGGRVFKAIKAAKIEEARGIQNIRDVEVQVRYNIKETFYEILYTDKLISVLEEQLKNLTGHLNAIKTRYNEGLDSDYTLMRQEVEVSNIQPQIIDAKRNRILLVNAIKVLMVIPQEDEFEPMGAFDYRARAFPQLEHLTEVARDDRPSLKAEKLREQSLRYAIDIEKAAFWPKLNFSTTWQWQGYADDWTISKQDRAYTINSMVTMSWPIFEGLKTVSRIKQAKAKHLQQYYNTSQFEDNVVKEVRDVYESLHRAREALASQEKNLNLARKATKIAGERFEAGLMSQLELNDTINSQARAEQNYLRAAFDCLESEAALEKVVGGEL